MRSICKKGSVTLVAVLALCALAAASASASQFYVGGKALTGTAKLATTVKVEEPIVISATREPTHLVITCTKASLDKGTHTVIEAPGTLKVEGVVFESCKMTGLTGCTMENELEFRAFSGLLSTAASPEDSVLFKPLSKNLFALLPFQGTCFAAGEFTGVVGQFAMKLTKGQEEKTEQEFTGEGTASTGLEITEWGNPHPPVYITGKLKLKLESGGAWSYH